MNEKGREPRFGDRVRGIHASESNPQRDGYFVEKIYVPRGQMNAGRHYRITDGEGNFWQYPPSSVELLPPNPVAWRFRSRLDDDEWSDWSKPIEHDPAAVQGMGPPDFEVQALYPERPPVGAQDGEGK